MLDAAVAAVQGVEELGDVANRVHAFARGCGIVRRPRRRSHLEARVARKLDVRLDADPGDDDVGVGDVARLEPQIDTVRAVDLVQRL